MDWIHSSKLRRWLLIAFFTVTVLITVRLYFRLTDDFRIANITFPFSNRSEWDVPPSNFPEQDQRDQILNQTFSYLGKGAQSYAFVSEDGNYVLKFFKFKHLKPSLLARMLPDIPPFDVYLKKVRVRKQKKFNSIFEGYRLAFEHNREESGLIVVQLNPNGKEKLVTVRDKIGLEREIDLGTVPYIIQKKGETLRTILGRLLDHKEMDAAKERINQIFALFLNEYQKGIYDRDHGVLHNTGFIGNQPFHLDVGKLSKDDKMKEMENYKKDLKKVTARMIPWIKEQYPDLAPEIVAFIELRLSQIFHHPVTLENVFE